MQQLQSVDRSGKRPRHERRPRLASAPVHDPIEAGGIGLITRDLGRRARAERTMLALCDSPQRPVEIVSAWEAGRVPDDPERPLLPDGFIRRLLDSGHAAVERIGPGRRLTHAAGAPVSTPEGTTGVLCAVFGAAPAAKTTLWMVESYARFAALCLHDPDVFDGLLDAARRDALTGCLCYGAVHHELIREIRRAARSGRSLSCCFIDLDRFKAVNDTHGHLHGSRVLASVAAALRQGVRDGDTLGRYGGDEFVALLPDTDEDAACLLAERLRTAIVASQPSGEEATVDASIGVSQWLPRSSAEEMLGAADDALRAAKERGGGVAVKASDVSPKTWPGKSGGMA